MRDLVVQSKRNSEDVHSYLTDLEGWQRDMEAKDNQLRGKTSEPTGSFSLSFDSILDLSTIYRVTILGWYST